jgi:hypothetical protein
MTPPDVVGGFWYCSPVFVPPTGTLKLGKFYPGAEANFAFVELELLIFADFLHAAGTPVGSWTDVVCRRHYGSAALRRRSGN